MGERKIDWYGWGLATLAHLRLLAQEQGADYLDAGCPRCGRFRLGMRDPSDYDSAECAVWCERCDLHIALPLDGAAPHVAAEVIEGSVKLLRALRVPVSPAKLRYCHLALETEGARREAYGRKITALVANDSYERQVREIDALRATNERLTAEIEAHAELLMEVAVAVQETVAGSILYGDPPAPRVDVRAIVANVLAAPRVAQGPR